MDKHPIVGQVMEYRVLTKLKSTYADGLLKVIGPDGRIRTTFQNLVTATGRLSSTDPNLQNIPVRTELGSEIRKMFVPRPGWVFVDADYSQIELRVLAPHCGGSPDAGGLPDWPGHSYRDGLPGLWRPAGGGHSPPSAAMPRQ